MVEHRSLAPSPPWAGRDGEGRSGSKGGEGPARGQSMSTLSGAHLTGHVSGSDGRFVRPGIVARRVARCTRGASRCSTGPLGRQLTDTRLGIVPWPLRPLGQVGTARLDRAARVAKGQRGGGQSCPPRKWVSFFTRPPSALSAAAISKVAVKPAGPPRLTAAMSPFRAPRT